MFWAWLSRLWRGWHDAQVFVQPRPVIAWQRRRLHDHWRRLSQSGTSGRPAVPRDIKDLIRELSRPNPLWGLPRIVQELRKLGIKVAKSMVETYRVRFRKPLSPTWKGFRNNHGKYLIALDFFVVPTVSYQVLFVPVILAHEGRWVVHVNITTHPTAEWTVQQVVEAFPWDEPPRYLRRDRDRVYGALFHRRIQHMGLEDVMPAPQSPWQNPDVERLIGSIRREVLDHVIMLNERHLRRVLHAYFGYDHQWRTHLALMMDCPHSRPVQSPEAGKVMAVPEVGGLHHHDERRIMRRIPSRMPLPWAPVAIVYPCYNRRQSYG